MDTKSVLCALAIGAASCIVALPANAEPARSAAVDESVRHYQRATAAAEAQSWEVALTEYDASNRASPSIAAQAGSADAHYHLHHDAEATDAYTKLLATNVDLPADQPGLRAQWEAQQQTARTRIAEMNERKNAAATPAPPRPKPPAKKPEKRRRKHDDDEDEDRDDEEPVRTAKNAVFAEIAGNGLVYSINYERFIDDTGFGIRAGFSYISLGASAGSASAKTSWLAIPLLANYYVGSANHKLQLGLGVTLLYVTSEASTSDTFGGVSGFVPLPTAAIGYRYIPARGGFNFGIGFTPFIIPGGDKSFLPWPGIGLGAVF